MKKLTLAVAFIFLAAQAANAADSGNELYRQAEEGEWFTKAGLYDVDALYKKAADAGSPHAFMAFMRNSITASEPGTQDRLAEELCPRARKIVKGWQKTDDPDAMFHMARYYADGMCEKRDAVKARAMLLRSAEAGNAKAQYYLGRSLVKKDAKAAFGWFAKAAESGFPQAMANQGACYLLGRGTEKDLQKGMELIDKALASGNSNALYDIAIWYLEGKEGLKQDRKKAREILEALVEAGYEQAKAPLADLRDAAKK